MAVLYRKYRPQTFSEVLNQKYIIQTLKNQVKSGQLSHAYLFTGSRGVGKTSVARILAKAVNCIGDAQAPHPNPLPSASAKATADRGGEGKLQGDACGVCEVCKQIENGNFLDMVEIDAASNTGVDNIRELIEHVRFSPSSGKYKVFIIDEVHMLSKGAFNALLKTLEEPPKHAIFILATTEINKVPATIVSRTQRFDFKALTAGDLHQHLEKISEQENLKFPKEVLQLIAENAEGSVRDALSLLDKLTTLGSEATIEDCQQLLGVTDITICENLLVFIALGKAQELPEFFNQLLEKGLDFKILNRDFLEYLRKALVFKITDGQQSFALSPEHLKKLSDSAGKLSAPDIMFIIRLFLRSYKDLESSPGPQIPLLLSAIEASLRKAPTSAAAIKIPSVVAPAPTPQPKVEVKPPVMESVTQPEAIAEVTLPVISLEEVEKFWPKVVANIREINSPLSSMLRSVRLMDVLGNKLVVGVKFLFDKQNLENLKNSSLISEACEAACGKKLMLSAQVIKPIDQTITTAPEAITEALKIFGGELIE